MDNSNPVDDRPHIDNPRNVSLLPEEEAVLRMMFAACQRVTIKAEFGGGLSSSRVFLIRPVKGEHGPELPVVVKIAPIGLITREWQAYHECVHKKLPGIAEIAGDRVLPPGSPWGGLRYTLMGESGAFEIESLYSYYTHASIADIRYVLEERLFEMAGPKWWQFNRVVADWPIQASYDFLLPVNLLIEPATPPPGISPYSLNPNVSLSQSLLQGDYVRLEGFVITEVELNRKAVTLNVPPRLDGLPASYRLRLQPVESMESYQVGNIIFPLEGRVTATRYDQLQTMAQKVLGRSFDLTADTLTSPGGITLPNPLMVWPALLGKTRDVRVSCIHGDMNLENILVEPASRNVSLIDFATARQDHVLHDLLCLETEVVTKLLPEALTETDLLVDTIYAFYRQLHEATFASGQATSSRSVPAGLEKPFEMLVLIRGMARQCLFDQNDWQEYYEGVALYLLGALKYKDLDRSPQAPLPKQAAFWAAAVACNFIQPVSLKSALTDKDWKRMQKYLPAEIYQEKHEATCLARMNQLLRAVVTYLPRHVALELLQEPVVAENKGRFLEGTLLFADLAEFTSLSEKLRKLDGQAGAEKLVQIINKYLDTMLHILFRYDGLLIRFGGDALLCLFTGNDHDQGAMNAVSAAWEMKQAMNEHLGENKLSQEIFPLSMKAGSNSGRLFAAHIGTPEHMEYILTGPAVERTAQAESAADAGEILVSRETYQLIEDYVQVQELAGNPGFYRVKGVHSAPVATGRDRWRKIEGILSGFRADLCALAERLDALTPYLPTGILSQLVYDPQQGQIEGQYRQVTILFANIVGMSKIMHARGDDEAGITFDLSQYFQAMQEEVQYYGGVINKVDLYDQGDKLVITFGAPVAHEKDTQRAVLTALAMQNALKRLPSPTAKFLSQRIGINTGFVFAGNVGSPECNQREYTVMGDDVNLAARLMSAAKPGQILISQNVWDKTQSYCMAEELAPTKVEGKSGLIPLYLLQKARDIREARDLSRLIHSDVVGRTTELDHLLEWFHDLVSGAGRQIVAIIGEAGVGKTRLVKEWQREAETGETPGSATWLTSCGHAYGQKANGIFVEIVEQLLAFADDDTPEERWNKLSARVEDTCARSAPGWFEEFSTRLAYLGHFLALDLSMARDLSERITPLEAEKLLLQTRLVICDLLEHAAQEQPLILILDDLHWADKASLDMLKFILNKISDDAPLFFCLIYRLQKERPIWQAWQEIERSHPDCHSMSLQELGDANGRQLLFNLLQTGQLAQDFQAMILKETNGNPLYVEEVLCSLIEKGAIVRQDGGGWRIAQSVEQIDVPDTLQQIIQSRIDELDFGSSPGSRRVLWMASVIGEEFTEDVLRHLFTGAGRQEHEMSVHIRELMNAAMIQKVKIVEAGRPRWAYQFRHGLVRQVAYENILVNKQREYHGRVGSYLEEKHCQDLERHYHRLAYHYDQGEQWEKAFEYHRLAGQRDAQAYANHEAASHLQRAIEIAGHVDPGVEALAQVHSEMGKVLSIMGEFDNGLEHLERACDLLEGISDEAAKLSRARVCYHIGRTYEQKGGSENLATALKWQGKGLAVLPQVPTAEAALLHVLGGIIGVRQDDLDRVVRESEQALSIAQVAGARSELGAAHRLLSVSARARGRLDSAMEHCQRGIEVDQGLSDLIALAKDYSNQGVIALDMGNWQLAKEADLKAIGILERVGEKYQLAITCCNLADKYRCLGDLAVGLDYARRGLDIFTRIGSSQGTIFAHAVLAPLFWRQGDLEQARSQLLKARELIEAQETTAFEPDVGRWLAQVYLTEGDIGRAEAEIQALLAPGTKLGIEAEPIHRLRGQILAAQGKLAEAAQVLQESLKRLEQDQAVYEMACTLLALAEVLAQMEGKAPEARACAERARRIFADLSAKLDLQEAGELVAKL